MALDSIFYFCEENNCKIIANGNTKSDPRHQGNAKRRHVSRQNSQSHQAGIETVFTQCILSEIHEATSPKIVKTRTSDIKYADSFILLFFYAISDCQSL